MTMSKKGRSRKHPGSALKHEKPGNAGVLGKKKSTLIQLKSEYFLAKDMYFDTMNHYRVKVIHFSEPDDK